MSKHSTEYANAYATLKPLGFTHADLAQLHRWEATLTRLSENQCNGWMVYHEKGGFYLDWDEKQSEKELAQAERIEKRVAAMIARVNPAVTVSFQGDPRGGAIRLLLPADADGHRVYNSWDGESWVIDW